MSNRLQTKTNRSKLSVRAAPYFERIEAGLFIGFRVLSNGKGTWVVRKRGDDGMQKTYSLGSFEEYKEALKAANDWAASVAVGVDDFKATVATACETYVNDLETRKSPKSAHDAKGRFNRLIDGKPIANILLSKLQTKHVKDWLNAQVLCDDDHDDDEVRRSKDSANRNLSSLKAALNMAFNDGHTATKRWEAVKPFKDVAKGRTRFITQTECDALMTHASPDMAIFMKAMILTACRPGELANIEAQHFDAQQGTLELTGKTGHRVVTLSTEACEFFTALSKFKIGKALLLHRADGGLWKKDWWKKLFSKARIAANLPDDVVLYSLRHYAISEMVANGIDSFLVARLAGTSTTMIDKHYGHLCHNRTRATLDAAQKHKAA
jgi:integrase